MMKYLGEAVNHAHLALWAKHLSAVDVRRLRVDNVWAGEWVGVVSAMRREMNAGAPASSDAVQSALRQWDTLIDDFSCSDAVLRSAVINALKTDPELQQLWSTSVELQEFVRRARTQSNGKP
jgi:hypothetical protein